MNYIDIIIGVILLFALFKGFLRGFVIEIFSLIGLIAGIILAVEFASPIANRFFGDSEFYTPLSVGVFLAIFLGSMILINLAARVLKNAINLTILKVVDNTFGSIFALLKWMMFVSLFIWLFESIGLELPSEAQDQSRLYPFVRDFAPTTFQYLSAVVPFFDDIFDFMDNFQGGEKLVYL